MRFTNLTLSAEHARIQSTRICREADHGAIESLHKNSAVTCKCKRFLIILRIDLDLAILDAVIDRSVSPLCVSFGSCLLTGPKQTVLLNSLMLLAGDELHGSCNSIDFSHLNVR